MSATSDFKPWPHLEVESRGDYRAEAYLEDHVGATSTSQASPPLRRGHDRQVHAHGVAAREVRRGEGEFDRGVRSVRENSGGRAAEAIGGAEGGGDEGFQLAAALVEHFGLSPGELLNSTIGFFIATAMESIPSLNFNLTHDHPLQVRDPVVVNVIYFFHFSDDGTLPQTPAGKSLGVLRATSLLHSTAEIRRLVATGSLPHEAIRRKEPKTRLCSAAYKYMFNACRVPRKDEDAYRIYDPSRHTHAIVACGGKFYSFDFVEEGSGAPLPLEGIKERLQKCVKLSNGGPPAPMLGYLTSDDRGKCAEAREELLRVGGSNAEEALELLESGAVMICLDENKDPVSKTQASEIMWTGGLTSGRNRWFDKSIQLICTSNGKAGMNGKHSMMDGMPVVGFCDYITKRS
ncbi:hypothetical protein ACHAWF_017132 [Thalassiosira exigua]